MDAETAKRLQDEYDRGRREGRADVGKYANAIGQIDCALGRRGARPLRETIHAVEVLALRAATDAGKLAIIGRLLEGNGCECACDHDAESHDASCERCLACRIDQVLGVKED